jgi:hypothetical protein
MPDNLRVGDGEITSFAKGKQIAYPHFNLIRRHIDADLGTLQVDESADRYPQFFGYFIYSDNAFAVPLENVMLKIEPEYIHPAFYQFFNRLG